jgi:hypothetical protein
MIQGFVKISDPKTGHVFVDKKNAIHYENMSRSLAESLANRNTGYIYEMAFGNGGSTVDATGVITYLPPNTVNQNADLYNQTYAKIVDDNSAANPDPSRNYLTVVHIPGRVYTDIVVTCLLDYGEPSDQQAFDNSTNYNG